MSYVVRLRRVSDGKEVDVVQEGAWDDAADWLWNEGNYGCDCNRAIWFDRATGMSEGEIQAVERECGDGDYLIERVTEDGKVVDDGEEAT